MPGIDDFIRYWAGFDPDAVTTIEGATNDEIADLEQLTGVPLPTFYRAFLQRMGRNTGALMLAWEASFAISDICDAYRTEVLSGEIVVPQGCILIGVGGIIVEEVYLQYDNFDGPILFPGERRLYAETLEKLLYRLVFTEYSLRAFPFSHQASSARRKRSLAEAERLAIGCGFARLWFSDTIAFCGEKRNSACLVIQYSGDGPLVVVSGTDEGEVHDICREFKELVD